MLLVISKEKTINNLKQDFSDNYPFLKLEFYGFRQKDPEHSERMCLSNTLSLSAAGLIDSGIVDVKSSMTVMDLERIFLKRFGLHVKLSRRSGMTWLETTMTENWSLGKQNEHGREISLTPEQSPVIFGALDKIS